MKLFLIVLGFTTLSSAMIPREGRVMPDPADIGEEGGALRPEAPPRPNPLEVFANATALQGSNDTKEGNQTICAYNTPCAWVVYKPPIKFIDYNITNSYCVCGKGTFCIETEDDTLVNAYVLHCREVDPAKLAADQEMEDSES